jgi:hypothetical protein
MSVMSLDQQFKKMLPISVATRNFLFISKKMFENTGLHKNFLIQNQFLSMHVCKVTKATIQDYEKNISKILSSSRFWRKK